MSLSSDMKLILIKIIALEIAYQAENKNKTESFKELLDLFEWAKHQEPLPFT